MHGDVERPLVTAIADAKGPANIRLSLQSAVAAAQHKYKLRHPLGGPCHVYLAQGASLTGSLEEVRGGYPKQFCLQGDFILHDGGAYRDMTVLHYKLCSRKRSHTGSAGFHAHSGARRHSS